MTLPAFAAERRRLIAPAAIDRYLLPTGFTAVALNLGPCLQNILRQSYDYLTIMPKLRSTNDERLIYQTSYEERSAFLRYDLVVISKGRRRQCSYISLRYSNDKS